MNDNTISPNLLKIAADTWRAEGKMQATAKPRLDPELAALIARLVTVRAVAADMINTIVFKREVFVQKDFDYWKADHMKATAELRKLGINLHTYSDNERSIDHAEQPNT
jgi:hypothetical protein